MKNCSSQESRICASHSVWLQGMMGASSPSLALSDCSNSEQRPPPASRALPVHTVTPELTCFQPCLHTVTFLHTVTISSDPIRTWIRDSLTPSLHPSVTQESGGGGGPTEEALCASNTVVSIWTRPRDSPLTSLQNSVRLCQSDCAFEEASQVLPLST